MSPWSDENCSVLVVSAWLDWRPTEKSVVSLRSITQVTTSVPPTLKVLTPVTLAVPTRWTLKVTPDDVPEQVLSYDQLVPVDSGTVYCFTGGFQSHDPEPCGPVRVLDSHVTSDGP